MYFKKLHYVKTLLRWSLAQMKNAPIAGALIKLSGLIWLPALSLVLNYQKSNSKKYKGKGYCEAIKC